MKDLEKMQHFVGCDVSKDTLDFAIFTPKEDYRRFPHIQVPNTKDGFRQFLKWLREHGIKKNEVVVAMEHTGFYSVSLGDWLHSKKCVFVMLHPMDVKNASSRGRNKTDMADAQFIADYVYTNREKLEPSLPESDLIRRLRDLRNERSMFVKVRASFKAQVKVIKNAGSIARIEKMIEHLSLQIARIEKEILKTIKENEELAENYRLLQTIPGIGFVNALNTLIATGNFTRFQTSRQYAKFCCIAPLSRESGKSIKGGNHVSQRGHLELKADLTEAAHISVRHDSQMKAYYQRKIKEGKDRCVVLNAVKFKLIGRMFAVIKRQKDYVDVESYRS